MRHSLAALALLPVIATALPSITPMREASPRSNKDTPVVNAVLASLGPALRTPQRDPRRASTFDWLPDVADRLRILEEHGADAERERLERDLRAVPPGRLAPQPPAAGEGGAR